MKFKRTISVSGFFIIYIVLLFLLIHIEKDAESSSIHSIWDSVWYSFVTLTTVGYGDLTPVTPSGKIIGLIFVLSSITILSVFIGKATDFISEMRERKKMGYKGTKFENHVVIVGLNSFVKQIIQTLLDANQQVAVVTDNKSEIDLLYERYGTKSFFVLYSSLDDYASFKKVNIEKAKIVHPALNTDTEELVMILNLREHYPDLEFIVVLEATNLKNTFHSAGVTYVLSKNEFASKLLASFIFEPAVADLTSDLISPNISDDNHEEFDIQQFLVTEHNPYQGKTWGEFFDSIKKSCRSLPIGIKRTDGKLLKIPPDDLIINQGDYVIFINNAEASRQISEELFNVEQGEKF
ncbi:potassium channel family protein [Bacteroidota bacterium]